MIDLEFLQKLIRTLDKSGLDHIEIERGGTRIRVSRSPAPAPIVTQAASPTPSHGPGDPTTHAGSPRPLAAGGHPTAAPSNLENLLEITSPMVGTFFRSSSPDSEPFTDVNKRISKGDPLCIIEAMKLMNELEAEIEGIVREVCVTNGEPVEYGQLLFRVEPG
ncbi:MAG: acetyl-CoA carboxylase biotin carboxyl carrier protein [Gemmatimonadetes bacterium]|nr:acetyl-CoA carboxylase biotin carboxyl carrier protein [Gemmatimonadota bacterium]